MLEGIDYSDARPGGAVIAAAGKRFAVRYLYPPVAGGKGLTAAEVQDLQAHGIAVACVYEGSAGGMRNGYGQGVADAKAAQAQLNTLPLDHGLPIYFAADWDASPADQTPINAYLDGVASVIGRARTGMYGGYWPLSRAKAAGKATWLWQTYAWSGSNVLAGIHLLQYSNGQWNGRVDYCRAMQAEYGQHAPAPVRPPVPTSVPKKPGPTLYTLARGIPNPAFWRRFGWWAGLRTGTADPRTVWKAAQAKLHAYGYTGPADGAPGVNTYKALQRLAAKGGYTGPVDGAPGTNTWRGVARYLNGQ